MPKNHNKNKVRTVSKAIKNVEEEEDIELSDLHLEYNEQMKVKEKWDLDMHELGLTTLKNFEFLPLYKPSITVEMLIYDYGLDKEKRWKKGMKLFPFFTQNDDSNE
jgi:hypothetical protein